MNLFTVGRYFGNYIGKELVIGEDRALLDRVNIVPDGGNNSIDLCFICRGLELSIFIQDFDDKVRLVSVYPDGTQKFNYTSISKLDIGIERVLYLFIEAVDNEEVDNPVGLDLTWK